MLNYLNTVISTKSFYLVLISILYLSLFSISCVETLTFTPIETKTIPKGANNQNNAHYCLGLYEHSTSCVPADGLPPSPEPPLVGYSHYWNSGTQPLACWQWVDCVYRAFVRFDLSSLKGNKVSWAKLKWVSKTKKQIGSVATGEGSCAKSLFVAKGPWTGFDVPGDLQSAELPDKTAYEIDVSHIVRNWVDNKQQNFGFFFTGPKEALGNKNNDNCITTLLELTLEVATPK